MEYKGRRAGSIGDTGVFSFHGSKTLTTGEGGLLATNDEVLFRRALFLRMRGRHFGDRMFFNTEVAYKYKMSSLQAALGLAQLERVDELVARKRQIFSWYERIERCARRRAECRAAPHEEQLLDGHGSSGSAIRTAEGRADGFAGRRKHRFAALFYPLSSIPAYRESQPAKAARERNKVAYRLSSTGVNLPSALNLTEVQVKRVCDTLKKILAERSAS